MKRHKLSSSFRDPDGFLFFAEGSLFRQVNTSYKNNYDLLKDSGLYQALVDKKLMVSHEELLRDDFDQASAYKIIKPELIPFISYPYEWSFGQYKDAALLTLRIQEEALAHGMSLKDASVYNIQFLRGRPIFIDTLSFEKAKDGQPWVAYRQFCQHFLAPLTLMAYRDLRFSQMMRVFIDGIPLDLASSLLPIKTKLKFGLMTHIHLHAKSQTHFADKDIKKEDKKMSQLSITALLDSLATSVKDLSLPSVDTEWGEYYTFTNYSETAFAHKKEVIKDFIAQTKAREVWDLGANNGEFSRLASDQGIRTIAFDIDMLAVEKNYQVTKKSGETNMLPLFSDLTNPSPGLGWAHSERMSLTSRGPSDLVMALALVHHLAISNNLPFGEIAQFMAKLGKYLIIEFVPKNDSKVQKLLSSREDIFSQYSEDIFRQEFSQYFDIIKSVNIKDHDRVLYLMKANDKVS